MQRSDGETSKPATSFKVAGYLLEPTTLWVRGTAGEVRLESKSMQVLLYLIEQAGQVVSRRELEKQTWPGNVGTEDAVTNTILQLRRVFGDDARNARIMETIPKSGYRLIAEVAPAPEEVA